jgi:putative oxidoreductase
MWLINFIKPTSFWHDMLLVTARLGLSVIFILAGMNKLQYFEGNAQYMASAGLPAELLPLVIIFELGTGILLLAGLLTQISALLLAGFSIVSGLLFHFDLGDQMQFIMFFKNIAMAGGFAAVAASGAGRFSLDSWLIRRAK